VGPLCMEDHHARGDVLGMMGKADRTDTADDRGSAPQVVGQISNLPRAASMVKQAG